MAAAELNICIEQGTTYNPILVLREKDTGTPIDITGWEFRLEIRQDGPGGTLIIRIDNTASGPGDEILILDAVNGKIQWVIEDTTTETFTEAEFEDAQYDFEAVDTLGQVRRLLMGCAALSLEVTTDGT
jgi:hypothetical protein